MDLAKERLACDAQPHEVDEAQDPVLQELLAANAAVFDRLERSTQDAFPVTPMSDLMGETSPGLSPVPTSPSVSAGTGGLKDFSSGTQRDSKSWGTIPMADHGHLDVSTDHQTHEYINSARLTSILPLEHPPNQGLHVSVADVGDPNGLPVLVFLGLGAVRQLVALYDELACALNLRLICADRWGLGRTDFVPASTHGVSDWSSVVGEVLDQLGIEQFALLAHSAGAPYAMATALRFSERVVGPIHLLAPWVSSDPKVAG